jgi:hypothetical protein
VNKRQHIRFSEIFGSCQNSHPIHIFTYYTAPNSHLNEKEIRKVYVKKVLLAVALAIVVLAGAGVAYATGSGDNSSAPQETGAGIEKAKSIALDHTNGGRVSGTEIGDEEGYYEVEVIRGDGSQVDVHLDRDYNVLSMPADHEGADSKDASNDSGG